jgi:glutathione S-transferase
MSGIIFHHYDWSPFSEKIRVMFGYTGAKWQSHLTREMPPRPVIDQLAGGYRKTPTAQIGADVFCDSHIIAREIADIYKKPLLALENCGSDVQAFVKEVELKIFFACIMAGGSKRLRQKMWQKMSMLDIARFMWDRIGMGRKSLVKMPGMRQSEPIVLNYLAQLESRITQPFLFGDEPCHGDFSAYHCLWFVRELGERSFINDYLKTVAWMDRMKAFGHGARVEITSQDALAQARNAEPRAIADEHKQDALIGRKVSIAPSDYGRDATIGTLVGSAPERWILARQAGDLGTLHVHFPKPGFVLSPV